MAPCGWRVELVLSAFWASTSLAQPAAIAPVNQARTFALDYTAYAACPNAAAVVDAIVARSAGASPVAPAAAVVRLKVTLLADGQSTLWVDLPEGSFRREFRASSCDEAVATMAVIASMVLEAEPAARRAMTDEVPAAIREAQLGPSEPPPPPPPRATPPTLAARAPVARPRPRARVAAGLARQQDSLRWAIAVGGALETAVAPTPPFGIVAGVEGWRPRASVWSPSMRLALLATASATEHATAGDGRFRLLAGQIQACPFRFQPGARLRLLPCASFEAGSFHAQGAGAARNVLTPTMPWLAGGALVRARFEVLEAVSLEATAGAALLARHDTFVLRPGSLVYDVPPWSGAFSVGLLWQLP